MSRLIFCRDLDQCKRVYEIAVLIANASSEDTNKPTNQYGRDRASFSIAHSMVVDEGLFILKIDYWSHHMGFVAWVPV